MSMTTALKNKKNRWAALALTALVIAGGSVAMPQAASAATLTSTCSKWASSSDCSIWVKASNDVRFKLTTDSNHGAHRYTVRAPSGRLLCNGTIAPNQGTVKCWLGSYTGRTKITVQDKWGVAEKIVATY
jgi:hypothetical protein